MKQVSWHRLWIWLSAVLVALSITSCKSHKDSDYTTKRRHWHTHHDEQPTPGSVDGDNWATLDVKGEDLETATAVDLLDSAGEQWQTVPATYADGMLTAWLDFRERPSETGAVRVTTISGSATYNVMYGNH